MTAIDGTTAMVAAADPADLADLADLADRVEATVSGQHPLLAAAIKQRTQAGNPSIGNIARATAPPVGRTTVARLFSGESLPNEWRFASIMAAMGGDKGTAERLWQHTQQHAQQQTRPLRDTDDPADEGSKIAPILGKKGIAAMLGVAVGTIRDLHNAAEKARATDTATWRHLPVPDRTVLGRPLWYPITVINWAVRTARLPREHGLAIPALPGELWSLADIAKYFGVDLEHTVQERWWWRRSNAVRKKQTPPPGALPRETVNADGIPLWDPPVIKAWGAQQGKLDVEGFTPYERDGQHWQSPPKTAQEQPPADPVQDRLDRGETFNVPGIAALFGVKAGTVRMWRGPWGSGKNFPEPDGGRTRSGEDTWERETIINWGVAEKRIVDGKVVAAVGGRPH